MKTRFPRFISPNQTNDDELGSENGEEWAQCGLFGRTFRVVSKILTVGLAVLWGICGGARKAAALEPFDNWANPPGWYLLAYPAYYSSQELTDKNGDTAVGNLDLHVYQNYFRATYYNGALLPKTWLFSAYVPVGRVEILNDHDVGLGDPTLVVGYFFVDDKPSNTYAGFGSYVDVPLGSYDPNKLANVGSNEWRVRPLLTFAKFSPPLDLEASLKYNFIFENDETRRKEGDQFIFESYAGAFLRPTFMAGAHFNYIVGRDDELKGARLPDTALKKFQAGPGLTWLASRRLMLVLEILADLEARNTTKGTLFLGRISWKME
jgi:hypothetical protein